VIRFGQIWANLGKFGQIWATLGKFGQIWAKFSLSSSFCEECQKMPEFLWILFSAVKVTYVLNLTKNGLDKVLGDFWGDFGRFFQRFAIHYAFVWSIPLCPYILLFFQRTNNAYLHYAQQHCNVFH
jgi:hypothetical protein